MNQAANAFDLGFSVAQDCGEWAVYTEKHVIRFLGDSTLVLRRKRSSVRRATLKEAARAREAA